MFFFLVYFNFLKFNFREYYLAKKKKSLNYLATLKMKDSKKSICLIAKNNKQHYLFTFG